MQQDSRGDAVTSTIGAVILAAVIFCAMAIASVVVMTVLTIAVPHAVANRQTTWHGVIGFLAAAIVLGAIAARFLCDRWLKDYSRHTVAAVFTALTIAQLVHMQSLPQTATRIHLTTTQREGAFSTVVLFGVVSLIAFEMPRGIWNRNLKFRA